MTTRTKRALFKTAVIFWLGIMLAISLSACASKPVIDLGASENPGNITIDTMQCERLAAEVAPMGTGIAGSAGMGALTGAAGGVGMAYFNDKIDYQGGALAGAIVGSVTGAITGAWEADKEQAATVRKCLENRGYSVL